MKGILDTCIQSLFSERVAPPLIRLLLGNEKSGLIGGVASGEGGHI